MAAMAAMATMATMAAVLSATGIQDYGNRTTPWQDMIGMSRESIFAAVQY